MKESTGVVGAVWVRLLDVVCCLAGRPLLSLNVQAVGPFRSYDKASKIADELQIEYDLKHEEEDPDLSPTVIFQVVSLEKAGK